MPKPPPSDGRDFYLVQARLRALTEKTPDAAIEWFNHRKDRADVSEAETDALFYGTAIALQRKGEYAEARTLLENLLDRQQHVAYELQLADLDLEAGDDEAALTRLADLYHAFPGNHAISMQYAQSLLKRQDAEQAATAAVVLRQQLLSHPEDPTLYELYARSANVAAIGCAPGRSPSPITCAAVCTRQCSCRSWSHGKTSITTNGRASRPASTNCGWSSPNSARKSLPAEARITGLK
jgi:predicted Zn-dependent protease